MLHLRFAMTYRVSVIASERSECGNLIPVSVIASERSECGNLIPVSVIANPNDNRDVAISSLI